MTESVDNYDQTFAHIPISDSMHNMLINAENSIQSFQNIKYDTKEIKRPIEINDKWFVTLDDIKKTDEQINAADGQTAQIACCELSSDVMEKTLFKCNIDDMTDEQMLKKYLTKLIAYRHRIKCITSVDINIQNDIKCTFLLMARNKNKGFIPFKKILEWLGCFDGDDTEQQRHRRVLNTKNKILKNYIDINNELYIKEDSNNEIFISFTLFKLLCMIIPSPKQHAVLEYYSQLQSDYLMLLEAQKYSFDKYIKQLHNELDEYASNNKGLYAQAQQYVDMLHTYERALHTRNHTLYMLKNYQAIGLRLEEEFEKKREREEAESFYEHDPQTHAIMVRMMQANKFQTLNLYKVTPEAFINPKHFDTDDDEDLDGEWICILASNKKIPNGLEPYFEDTDDRRIMYAKKKDLEALDEYLETHSYPWNSLDLPSANRCYPVRKFPKKSSHQRSAYQIDVEIIRHFLMKQYCQS